MAHENEKQKATRLQRMTDWLAAELPLRWVARLEQTRDQLADFFSINAHIIYTVYSTTAHVIQYTVHYASLRLAPQCSTFV